ncbi:MAG: sulfatase [Planctomycetota bacterium]
MPSPNLLFLFTDEQRADTMAAYGNTRIQTPNLNRLADESTVFDRAYVTQPVCTPSRSSILTGLWPHTTGCTENNLPLPAGCACLPEMLDERYGTGYHGKWHLGDEIFAQHGFDDWVSIEDMYIPYYSEGRDRDARSSYHHFLVEHGFEPGEENIFRRGTAARLPEPFSKPAFLAREAARFIRENRDRPFCLFVNFLEPHMPFFGPRDGQHDPAEVTLPANFENPPTADQPLKTHFRRWAAYNRGHSGLPLRTEADWRRMIANYWGLCSLVDTYVGQILAALDDCGLADDTIVVYTSDHGDMMGSHRLIAKCVMFEEAVRVPLLVRLPGQTAPRRVRCPVSQIDLVPTLLDLMGQPIPDALQGKSLRPQLEGGASAAGDVFIEWNGPDASIRPAPEPDGSVQAGPGRTVSRKQARAAVADPVRTILAPDGWKYNHSTIGEHELYDLNADPHETDNLAADPQQQSRMADLTGRIRRWQDEVSDRAGR